MADGLHLSNRSPRHAALVRWHLGHSLSGSRGDFRAGSRVRFVLAGIRKVGRVRQTIDVAGFRYDRGSQFGFIHWRRNPERLRLVRMVRITAAVYNRLS